jgi:hypothetical protein
LSSAVTIVTPVANLPSTARNVLWSTLMREWIERKGG